MNSPKPKAGTSLFLFVVVFEVSGRDLILIPFQPIPIPKELIYLIGTGLCCLYYSELMVLLSIFVSLIQAILGFTSAPYVIFLSKLLGTKLFILSL